MITLNTCLAVSQLCCSLLNYNPPGNNYDLSPERKQFACSVSQEIETAANQYSIEPTLMAALIIVESRFNPRVRSRAGACGLTQVVPRWTGGESTGGTRYTCRQLMNPVTSIRVGTRVLDWWIKKNRNNTRRGLCGYNGGNRGCRVSAGYARRVLWIQRYLQPPGC